MTQSTIDRKALNRLEKQARQSDRLRADVIRNLCSNFAGRQYLWDQLSQCHIFQTTYSSDALQMAFLEGERNRGLALLADIMTACPEQFIQMQREANDRDAAADTGTNSSANGAAEPDSDTSATAYDA